MDNTCVQCGEIIPEGRMICPKCEMGCTVTKEKGVQVGNKKPIKTKVCPHCKKKYAVTSVAQIYCSIRCREKARKIREKTEPYDSKKPRKPGPQDSGQLCWSCINATNNGCSWSKNFKPVKGWTATPTILTVTTGRTTESFSITKCPQYIADKQAKRGK